MINARYTEVLYNLLNNEEVNNKINVAMSTYPLYEQKTQNSNIPIYIPTRVELNKKILDYYKYREIAFETVGRFIGLILLLFLYIILSGGRNAFRVITNKVYSPITKTLTDYLLNPLYKTFLKRKICCWQ